jgi:uncharacterized repeat protein (TIGR02543 family)
MSKEREKGKILLCSLFFALCSLILACQNPVEPFKPELPMGKGSFSLSVTVADFSRTILPAVDALKLKAGDFSQYAISFTPASGGGIVPAVDRSPSELSVPIILEAGTYTITVTAFFDEGKIRPAARGSKSGIVISAGENTSASIELEAIIDSNYTGSFNYTVGFNGIVNFPQFMETATMEITPLDTVNGSKPAPINFLSDGQAADTLLLNSGYYNVAFTLIKTDGQTLVWRELLYVYVDLDSEYEREFTDAQFSETRYTVTYIFNNGLNPGYESVDITHGYIVTLSPAKINYVFGGWYTNEGLTIAYDGTPIISDITLYAKWVTPGTGGVNDPFFIYTEEELRQVGTGKDGRTLAAHYKLKADITLTSDWAAIGTSTTPFTGSFDGENHSITGLTINVSTQYQGFFASLNGSNADNMAVVKNLNLVNVNISSTNSRVGGIAGYINANAQVENSSVSGVVSGVGYVGGVVGNNNEGTVQYCSFTGNVTNTSNYTGGIVGYQSVGIVQNCFVTGNVNGGTSSSNWSQTGGVVGYISGAGMVRNCYATGNVSGDDYVGGVVGWIGTTSGARTVQNCYATGNVSSTGDQIGGLVGNSAAANTAGVRNSVALNPSITATGTSFGRVVGNNAGRTNNYARNDMQKDGKSFVWTNKGVNASDGEDIAEDKYSSQIWWSSAANTGPAFDFTSVGAWEWHTANKLPILKNVPGSQNPKVTAFTTAFLTITAEEIEDLTFETIDNGRVISRSGTGGYETTLVLNAPTGYTRYEWSIGGVDANARKVPLSTDPSASSVTVDASDMRYNSIGRHAVYLVVYKGDVPYSKTIMVSIVE